MSTTAETAAIRQQAGWMVLSALLFGYIGFSMGWAHRYTADSPPQLLVMVVVLMWSLRGGSIAFAVAAILTMAGSMAGLLLYAVTGVVTAVAFLAVAIWDWTTPQYYTRISPMLLSIFAIWNGYSSVLQLRAWLSHRANSRASFLTTQP